jgi:hypothetical protein
MGRLHSNIRKGIRAMDCFRRVLRLPALRLAFAAFLVVPSACAIAADCAQWNVAGAHDLHQSNTAKGYMTLQQDGTQFKGQVTVGNKHRPDEVDSYYDYTNGDIVGTVVGNKFEATVYWDDNKVGVYTGQIGPQGLVVGRTFNKNNPSESADWHGSPAFNCLTASVPNPPANNGNSASNDKPAMALGRVHLEPTIVEPQKGGAYAPQTPLSVRVTPGKGAKDTVYRIDIQRQNVTHSAGSTGFSIEWADVITFNAPAGVPFRYWGGGQAAGGRPEMLATSGAYRMRARATEPQPGPPSDWVEFRIKGQGATQNDAANASGPGPQNAAQNKAAAALNAQTLTPKALSGAATLNAQPLSSKSSPATLSVKPLAGAAKNTGAATSNPQAAPQGLQQAPSTLR